MYRNIWWARAHLQVASRGVRDVAPEVRVDRRPLLLRDGVEGEQEVTRDVGGRGRGQVREFGRHLPGKQVPGGGGPAKARQLAHSAQVDYAVRRRVRVHRQHRGREAAVASAYLKQPQPAEPGAERLVHEAELV